MTYQTMKRLSLTEVKPNGWLLRQLEIQMDGLSGKLHDIWESVGSYSGWLGGSGDGWERVPYWLDGLLPLAYYLDDKERWDLCIKFIDFSLNSQDEDGNFGPLNTKYDRWSRYVMLKVLIQYHEITKDKRVLPFFENYFIYFDRILEEKPISEWSEARVPDYLYCVKWLYEQTKNKKYVEYAKRAEAVSLDWNEFLEELPFPYPTKHYINWKVLMDTVVPSKTFDLFPFHYTHIVNVTMGFKHPALKYWLTGDDKYRNIAKNGINRVIERHGVVSGCINGDEHLAGNDPSQGSELCAVVEYMFSLQSLIEIFGESKYGDLMERLAYNALPATISEDFMGHQYLQQANQVQADVSERPWFNNRNDSNTFGLEPNFGCCTANMHQGWPKLVQSLWYTEGNVLTNMVYAPSSVETTIEGEKVAVELCTEYPFRDRLTYHIVQPSAKAMTLKLRIPDWCTAPSVICDGATINIEKETATITINKEFKQNDTIEVTFPMEIRYSEWAGKSTAVERGPLVYGLNIKERWESIKEVAQVTDYAIYAESPWNYAISPNEVVSVTEQPISNVPFSKETPSVTLTMTGLLLPEWTLDNSNAGKVPIDVDSSGKAKEKIELIPFGCTKLRISQFPIYNK